MPSAKTRAARPASPRKTSPRRATSQADDGNARGAPALFLVVVVLAAVAFYTGYLEVRYHLKPLPALRRVFAAPTSAPAPTPTLMRGSAQFPLIPPAQAATETQPATARRQGWRDAARALASPTLARHVTSGRASSGPEVSPRVAIVIDDCGNSLSAVEGFIYSPSPITLSILPHLAFSVDIARAASAAGKGVMLHFPLEPIGNLNPGPGTVRVDMSDEQMQAQIKSNLASVPCLQGVNNHEGSKATADARTMRNVLKAVHDHGLFFIDSFTAPNSVAFETAQHMQVPCARRDVFLDNDENIDAIKEQMRLLIREARLKGEALGIGHARPAMQTAFVEMLPAFEESGVQLVTAGDFIHDERRQEKTP